MTQDMVGQERIFNVALKRATSNAESSAGPFDEVFFDQWFKSYGRGYFFLFYKNLQHTNIQFAELLALIRVHATEQGTERRPEINSVSVGDFRRSLKSLTRTFNDARSQIASTMCSAWASVLKSTVVFEPLNGSCAVMLPPHIDIDLRKVCGESGYVHSCGPLIFSDILDRTSPTNLYNAIGDHLKVSRANGRKKEVAPLFFAVFSHEDFSKSDRDEAALLRNGLDDVKIYVEKYYVGDSPLVRVLNEIRSRFSAELVIPPAGDFKTQHSRARETHKCDPDTTLWLLIDRSIGRNTAAPGDERFLVCYDQRYRNENPFQVFDENKPAWMAHTTAPHSLTGAMLNLTRPNWGTRTGGRRTRVWDPFGGTGTTWLEAAKLPDAEAYSTDIEPVSPLLTRDNLEFFSASPDLLSTWVSFLRRISEELTKGTILAPVSRRPATNMAGEYDLAMSLLERCTATEEIVIDKELAASIEATEYNVRLLLYLGFKSYVRHGQAFDRGHEEWRAAYLAELSSFIGQTDQLLRIRQADEASKHLDGPIATFLGKYSRSCTISASSLGLLKNECSTHVGQHDARNPSALRYDVVISDPPYGFNTSEDPAQLAEVYAASIRSAITSIGGNGQLVLSVPARSHTGRRVPAFATPGWVTQQVLSESQQLGAEVIIPARAVPGPGQIFRPPYYWESERALRRVILHFHIRMSAT